MLGKKLNGGRYEILQKLGQGGFGETYIAQDKFKPVNSQCVVKHLKPKRNDPDTLKAARELFEREAQVLYKLGNHHKIPLLLAHFEEDEEFYLVEELMAGNDLKKELESVQRFSEEQVIALLRNVLEILQFVHQQNVIHRDIKPSNLIRRQDGRIALIDFGAVKQISTQETTSDGLTSFTIAVGTKDYMPNEQQGGKPRFSSDIYALGMTAIHALTGKSPSTFKEDARGDIIWREYVKVNNRLAAILDKMVKSHYRDRYDRVEEVLKDLDKLPYSSSDISSSTDFSTVITRKIIAFRLPKLKYILIGLAATGIAIAGGLIIPQLLPLIKPKSSVNVSELVQKGDELYNSSKYEEAIAIYDQALQKNPDKPAEIWKSKASSLFNLEKYEEAIAGYNKALEIKPDDVDTLNSKGIALKRLKKHEEAIAAYSQAIKIDPKNSNAWNNRGVALSEIGKLDEGLKDIDKSLELAPEDYTAWHNKGLILEEAKRYEEAIVAYDKANSISPNLHNTWFNRGDSLYSLGRYKEAVYSYDEAIRIKHDYPEALYKKGKTLLQLSRYEDALVVYNQALELQRKDVAIWEGKLGSLIALKRYENALESFQEAEKNITPSATLLNYQGVAFYRLQRYEEALKTWEKTLQKDDNSLDAGTFWRNKGASLSKLNRFTEALPAYEKATTLQPSTDFFWFEKGKVLSELQRYKEAVAAFDKAIELKPDYQEAKEARKEAIAKQ